MLLSQECNVRLTIYSSKLNKKKNNLQINLLSENKMLNIFICGFLPTKCQNLSLFYLPTLRNMNKRSSYLHSYQARKKHFIALISIDILWLILRQLMNFHRFFLFYFLFFFKLIFHLVQIGVRFVVYCTITSSYNYMINALVGREEGLDCWNVSDIRNRIM